jgi:hypothetical protein
VTQLRTGLAILLVLSSAPSVAQMAPAATEEPGCYAYLVYPSATRAATPPQSPSCEPGEHVRSYDRAARPDAALEEHAFNRADASIAEGRAS